MSAVDDMTLFDDLLRQANDALKETVTVELLSALAGQKAVDTYKAQTEVVHAASEAHRQAAAAVKAQAAAARQFQTQMQAAGVAAVAAFQNAQRFASQLSGMAAVANPTAWATMKDSITLVAMQIGRYFLPAIITVAYKAQEFARWLAELSPATKSTITQFATVAGLAFAFGKVLSLANTATLGLVPKAFGALPGAAQGVVGAFALASAGVAYFAYKVSSINAAMDKAIADMSRPIEEKLSRAQFEERPEFKDLAGQGNADNRRRLGDAMLKEAQTRATAANKDLERVNHPLYVGRSGDRDKAQQEAVAANEHLQVTLKAYDELIRGRAAKFTGPGRAGAIAGQIGQFLSHYPKEMQPRFSAVEEARKGIQVANLKDPLEQEMIKLNREAAKEFMRLAPLIIERLRKGELPFVLT